MNVSTGQPAHNPLTQAFRACRRHFAAAALFSACLNVLYLAPTIYMLQIYDRVVSTRGLTTLAFLTLMFVFAVATLSLLDYARSILLARASVRLDRLVSARVISALTMQRGRGRTSQVLREFDMLRGALTGAGVLALFDAPWTPIYIGICFIIHPALGTLALCASAILLFIAWLNEKATHGPLQRAGEAAGRSYSSLDYTVSAGGVVRALGMGTDMVRRHMGERQTSTHLQSEAAISSATYLTLTKFVRLLLQSLSLGLGAWLAIEQKISAGSIFAASLLVTRALAPIEQVLGAWRQASQARDAYKSLNELFEEAGDDHVRTQLPAPGGRLELERVYILSPNRDRQLISDASFRLEPGEALGVIGPSGAGKSTLVRAIGGATPADQGAIRFDGADAKDWDGEQLARHIGYVPQDPSLFRGTVKENIARFQTPASEPDRGLLDAAVVRAARLCGAHDVILRLPNGYDTELGFGGVGLSAGQAQRIALARALYGEPSVVIMDEPNAHLDAEGEADLLTALAELQARGVTTIVVAHRTGILNSVDKLMVVRDGRISMFGPRDEVIARISGPPRPVPVPGPAANADAAPRQAGAAS